MRAAAAPASALLLTLLALAACGRAGDSAENAVPPADAPSETSTEAPPPPSTTDGVNYTRPLNLLGNEPFWALKIRPEGLSFSAPDQADQTATNPGPVVIGEQGLWMTKSGEAEWKITLDPKVCQDGMSGLLYPFTAELVMGEKTYQGCAAYADAMPKAQ